MKNPNFKEYDSDQCLYKRNENVNISYIIVYVNILVAAREENTRKIHAELSKEYEIKNLSKVSQYLGINIKELDNGNLELDQKIKINEIAENLT